MKEMRCASCGGIGLTEKNGYYVCEFCGTRFKRETSDVSAAAIDQSENVKHLLKRADMYWSAGMRDRAKLLYEQILEIDATNETARQRY